MSNPWLVPQSGPQHQRFGQKSEGTVKFTESVRRARATSWPVTMLLLAPGTAVDPVAHATSIPATVQPPAI
jgi:hypothetical protein